MTICNTYLSNVIFVKTPLQADPGLGLEICHLFNNLQYIGHLFDGDHLLVPEAHAQVSHSFYGSLHMGLLVRLHIDVAFDMLRSNHRLDLERLYRGDKNESLLV